MCCIFTILVFLGPRAAILMWWLIEPLRFSLGFGDTFLLPILGFVFLPWTTLMWLALLPVNGLIGFDWVWLALALLADVAAYGGGAYGNRGRFQGA